ncbi:MAG: hypothetical protein ABJF86_17870 [Tateyamaria sp.]|uniref:hypothetical protein n=1 Tax=Tateyamaria sp. TaxID=1929288 RepID=UPI0032949859
MDDEPDILMPSGGSIHKLAEFSVDLHEFPTRETLLIGADHVEFLRPTCLIFLAKSCKMRTRAKDAEKVVYKGLNKLTYANNLGFSDALSLEGRPYPQGAFGGHNYIPMSVLSRTSLDADALEVGDELGDAIERRCEDIARIVSQHQKAHLSDILARSFCEIFRNCFEHGGSENAVFCAQYWPQLNTVEICIADRGMGVKASLTESKHTKPVTDSEALGFSLMPGVSSKAWRHKKKKAAQKSVWDNAGYGLFFAHQLFGKLGHFYIASGNSSLFLDKDKYKEIPCAIEGTLVSMRMSLSDERSIT